MRVKFVNLDKHSETCFTVGILPIMKAIPAWLPAKKRRRLKHELMKRHMFLLFPPLMEASYTRVFSDCQFLFPHISMSITDQAEDRAVLSLKDRDSYMDCSLCMLPLMVRLPGTNFTIPFPPLMTRMISSLSLHVIGVHFVIVRPSCLLICILTGCCIDIAT